MSTETEHQVTPPKPVAPTSSQSLPPADCRGEPSMDPSRMVAVLRKIGWRVAPVLVLAALSIPVWRSLQTRATPQIAPLAAPGAQAVRVASVTREDLYTEVSIPAEFRPYEEVELHAKVSGYVSAVKVDFGDRVRAGQLLAMLEVPELLNQLTNAVAVARRAEADYRAAHTNYARLRAVTKDNPNLVAEQDVDNAEAKDGIAEAAVAAAKAEVERYRTLVSYTKITAPFDGVITRRYADPGALIQAGTTSATQSLPLVRLSDNYRLRLDFPVSVTYIKDIHLGDRVEVRVESLGAKTFTGAISRFAQKVDEDTRTMITEIEVPNPNLELVPGMYATLTLKVDRRPQVLTIPAEAVSQTKTPTVYLINREQEIEERPVTLGLETPGKYEVLSGLKEDDLVMIGSRSQVKPGQKVEAKLGPLVQQ